MTDEETAEAKDYAISRTYPKFETDYIANFVLREVEGAFLAGIGKGRPQWHDLREDPNDLPKIEIGTSSITVLNEDGNKVYYDYDIKYWRYDDEELHITASPIAWCEVPQFEEEIK